MMKKAQETPVTVETSDKPAPTANTAGRSFNEIIADWTQAWTSYYQRKAGRAEEQRCAGAEEQSNKVSRSA